MSVQKHTPGDWQANGSHVYGPDPDRELICQVLSDHGRLIGDRDLIVAIPRMLEALEVIATSSSDMGARLLARGAIAKATGELSQ